MNHTSILAIGALVTGVAAAFAPATASAVAANRHEIQNATGLCQAALPSFEGNIRKRPTGIANEGTSITFVSCSPVGDAVRPSDNIAVRLTNRNAYSVMVNCVLVNGSVDSRTFFPKSVEIAANSGAVFFWTAAADNDGTKFDIPNVQCAYDPGVELNYYERTFNESVGSPN